jgi:hypothetical protein
MAVAYCPNCGAARLPDARFCGGCGSDFEALGRQATPVPSPTLAPPATPPPLVMPASRPQVGLAAADRPMPAARRRGVHPVAVIGLVLAVLVLAGGGAWLLLLRNGGAGPRGLSSPVGVGAALAPASLDPDAPVFPVPAGATLLNAQVEGSGPVAYRLEAWNSPLGFDATVAFYAALHDARWTLSGPLAQTPQAAQGRLSDGQGVFAQAALEIDRTVPVRVAVQFVPPGFAAAPPASQAPGPTIAFGKLPAATALPAGFPSQLIPAGQTLVDGAVLSGTYFAIFTSAFDVPTLAQAYQSALQGYAQGVVSTPQGQAMTITFTTGGHPGMVVLSPTSSGSTEVSVEVTP